MRFKDIEHFEEELAKSIEGMKEILSKSYKVDNNLYVGSFKTPKVEGTSNTTVRPLIPWVNMVTNKGQLDTAPVTFSSGKTMGGYIISIGAGEDNFIREWGDDVALVSTTGLTGRVGVATYNKEDLHRVFIEIAVSNGLRSL